ncbi:MAG: sugar ABC transporter permease [Actinobacteria bacterium]|nr:sugar ABC transporter permease [Actinomycetota bacterium]
MEAKTPYAFTMPVIGFLALTIIFPLFFSFWVSFHRYNIMQKARPFVGFGNFISLFKDNIFYSSVLLTFCYSVAVVLIQIGLGYLIAKLFVERSKFSGVGTTLLLTPMLIAPVVVGLIWKFMFEPEIGIINYVLSLLHIPAVSWTSQKLTTIIAVGIADVWQWSPFCFLVILAGLRGADKEIYEASDVDGVSLWQRELNVTFPSLKSIMSIIVLIRFIDAFRTFDLIYILSRGGPGVSTYVLSIFAYMTGLNQFEIGKATAIAIILLLLIIIATNVISRVFVGRAKKNAV